MRHGLMKLWVYMNTSDWIAPEREYLDFDEPAIRRYIEEHPIPENKDFKTADDIVYELCHCTGLIALSPKFSDEFVEWYDDLISETNGCDNNFAAFDDDNDGDNEEDKEETALVK